MLFILVILELLEYYNNLLCDILYSIFKASLGNYMMHISWESV